MAFTDPWGIVSKLVLLLLMAKSATADWRPAIATRMIRAGEAISGASLAANEGTSCASVGAFHGKLGLTAEGGLSLVDVPAKTDVGPMLVWVPEVNNPAIGWIRLSRCMNLPIRMIESPDNARDREDNQLLDLLAESSGRRIGLLFLRDSPSTPNSMAICGVLDGFDSGGGSIDVWLRRSAVQELSKWWRHLRCWGIDLTWRNGRLAFRLCQASIGAHSSPESIDRWVRDGIQVEEWERTLPGAEFRKLVFQDPQFGHPVFFGATSLQEFR